MTSVDSIQNEVEYIQNGENKYAFVLLQLNFNSEIQSLVDISKLDYKFEYIPQNNTNIMYSSGIYTPNGLYWDMNNFNQQMHTIISEHIKNTNYTGDFLTIGIRIPIILNDNTTIKLTVNNIESEIKYNWIEPILYKNSKKTENGYFFSNVDFNTYQFTPILLNYPVDKTIENLQITSSVINNESTYTVMLIPNKDTAYTQLYNPLFYISNDLEHRENNEGGMMICNTITMGNGFSIMNYVDEPYKEMLNNYNLYISDNYTLNTTLRYDIDFI